MKIICFSLIFLFMNSSHANESVIYDKTIYFDTDYPIKNEEHAKNVVRNYSFYVCEDIDLELDFVQIHNMEFECKFGNPYDRGAFDCFIEHKTKIFCK